MYQFILIFILSFSVSAKVKFSPAINYNESDLKALSVAEKLANDLFESECFKSFMSDRETGKHSSKYKLHTTNGKTAIEVVEHLKSSNITTPVKMYYKNNKVVGYRWTGNPTIHTNSKFHRGANACSRSSNLTHEWSHVAGYNHTYKANRARPFSVPYSINEAFKKCCKCASMLKCEILSAARSEARKFKTVCSRSWKTLWVIKSCYQKEISP